jgi:hypothetical protein
MNPVRGNVYDASEFSNFGATYHDWMVYSVDEVSGLPVVSWIPKGSSKARIQSARIVNPPPQYNYIVYVEVLADGRVKYIEQTNVATLAMAYLDDNFRVWLDTNYSTMLVPSAPLPLAGGKYTHAWVARSRARKPEPHASIYVIENNAQYPHTTKFWTPVNSADLNGYVAGIQDYDLKFFQGEPSAWFNPTVDVGIRDAHLAQINNVAPISQGGVNAEVDLNTTIVYTKSLYEESINYFDGALARLDQELGEE